LQVGLESKPRCLLLGLNWAGSKDFGILYPSVVSLPLEFAYILSDLLDKKHAVSFIDLFALRKELEEARTEIKKSSVVVICSSPSYLFWRDGMVGIGFLVHNLRLLREINPSAALVLIGPHGTVLPETLISEDLDFIIRGEPELAIAALLEALEGKRDCPPGICFRKDAHWTISDDTPAIEQLDDLPPLNLEQIELRPYSYPEPPADLAGCLTTVYEASRGCFFDCIFCWRNGFRDRYRRKSLSRIEGELADLQLRGVKYLYLIDEIFPLDSVWCSETCRLMKSCGIAWGSQTRPEFIIGGHMVETMIRNGCRHTQIGLETTNSAAYKLAKKAEPVDLEKLNLKVRELSAHGIAVDLFLTLGLPGDSEQSFLDLVKRLRGFQLDKVGIYLDHKALPFPNTELWRMGIAEGKPLRSWPDISAYAGLIGNEFRTQKQLERAMLRAQFLFQSLKQARLLRLASPRSLRGFLLGIARVIFYRLCFHFPGLKGIIRSALLLVGRAQKT